MNISLINPFCWLELSWLNGLEISQPMNIHRQELQTKARTFQQIYYGQILIRHKALRIFFFFFHLEKKEKEIRKRWGNEKIKWLTLMLELLGIVKIRGDQGKGVFSLPAHCCHILGGCVRNTNHYPINTVFRISFTPHIAHWQVLMVRTEMGSTVDWHSGLLGNAMHPPRSDSIFPLISQRFPVAASVRML